MSRAAPKPPRIGDGRGTMWRWSRNRMAMMGFASAQPILRLAATDLWDWLALSSMQLARGKSRCRASSPWLGSIQPKCLAVNWQRHGRRVDKEQKAHQNQSFREEIKWHGGSISLLTSASRLRLPPLLRQMCGGGRIDSLRQGLPSPWMGDPRAGQKVTYHGSVTKERCNLPLPLRGGGGTTEARPPPPNPLPQGEGGE